MEIDNDIIFSLVKNSTANSTKLDGIAISLQAMSDRMDAFSDTQKEMHKQLGSKASLAQWDDYERRIRAIELRQKIKDSWIKAGNWILNSLRNMLLAYGLLTAIFYSVEKKDVIAHFLRLNKD